jgi:hypothetical protein
MPDAMLGTTYVFKLFNNIIPDQGTVLKIEEY